MVPLINAVIMLVIVTAAIISSARQRGIPVLLYAGACLLIAGVGVGGVIVAVRVLERFGTGAGAYAVFFAILGGAVAVCIAVAVFLFTRLQEKYSNRTPVP